MAIRRSHITKLSLHYLTHCSLLFFIITLKITGSTLAQTTSMDLAETSMVEFNIDLLSSSETPLLITDTVTETSSSLEMQPTLQSPSSTLVQSIGITTSDVEGTLTPTPSSLPPETTSAPEPSTMMVVTPTMINTAVATSISSSEVSIIEPSPSTTMPPQSVTEVMDTSSVTITPSPPVVDSMTVTMSSPAVTAVMNSSTVTTSPATEPPPPPPSGAGGLTTAAIIGIAAAGGVGLFVLLALVCCCMCCCLCGSSHSQEYTTGNDNRPIVVVRTFGQDFQRTGSLISRGSRASIASSIRSSIRRLSGRRRSKTKDGRMMREDESVAMKVTPL